MSHHPTKLLQVLRLVPPCWQTRALALLTDLLLEERHGYASGPGWYAPREWAQP